MVPPLRGVSSPEGAGELDDPQLADATAATMIASPTVAFRCIDCSRRRPALPLIKIAGMCRSFVTQPPAMDANDNLVA
jgi:hypothetical protein